MTSINSLAALNRIYVVLSRSLPMYLVDAVPWTHRGSERTEETLSAICEDREQMIERIGALILDEDGTVAAGEFPMSFTGLHDLSIDYLLSMVVTEQKKIIAEIESCADELRLSPTLQAVAQEALGLAKGQLESLEELASEPVA